MPAVHAAMTFGILPIITPTRANGPPNAAIAAAAAPHPSVSAATAAVRLVAVMIALRVSGSMRLNACKRFVIPFENAVKTGRTLLPI